MAGPTIVQPSPARSKKPLVIGAIAVVLLLVIGIAAYQIFTPNRTGGPSAGSTAPAANGSVSLEPTTPSQETHAIDNEPPPANAGAITQPTPAPKPEKSSRQPSKPKPSAPAPDQGQQMYQKAQAAISQGHYFEPVNDSALHWAILARQAGNPGGKALEDQIVAVYKSRVAQYYNSGNYQGALALVNEMLKFYPGNPSLLAQQKKFQDAMNNSKH